MPQIKWSEKAIFQGQGSWGVIIVGQGQGTGSVLKPTTVGRTQTVVLDTYPVTRCQGSGLRSPTEHSLVCSSDGIPGEGVDPSGELSGLILLVWSQSSFVVCSHGLNLL